MKPARLIVAGIAGLAGLMALMLSNRSGGPAKVAEAPAPKPEVRTTEVLVARSDLTMGTALNPDLLSWVKWPEEMAAPTMILKSARPNAVEEFKGAITRAAFFANEPIREEKVIKGAGSGFLSAILPAGKRAVAITIDSRGASSAGGFILPNDYVDVITVRQGGTSGRPDAYKSTTILTNIRVLAIGQNIQEKNGEKVVVGETATLELDPYQAEQVMLHQRNGSLSLALRAMADANKPDEGIPSGPSNGVTVVRFGVAQEASR
jgi:pilus assembly protein CpaB